MVDSFSVIETVLEIYKFPLVDLRPILADSIADVAGMLNRRKAVHTPILLKAVGFQMAIGSFLL